MSSRFSGKVVLIAGGTGGLGRAVSEAFLAEDARVIVTWQNQKEFVGLAESVATKSLLEGYSVDVTDEAAVGRLIDQVTQTHGRLDVMVNTVGAYSGGPKLWEEDTKVFDQMIALNLRSGLVLARAVVPAMLRMKRGAIVNVASKAAFEHTANAFYAASKAGALAMMDSLADELKNTGVRVNSILPSIIDTEANRRAMPGADFEKWPKPEDIARVILFLCSDDARVVHGAAVSVYGDS